MKKSTIVIALAVAVSFVALLWLTNSEGSDLIPKYSEYSPALNAANHRHQKFSDIDFDNAKSVLNGCTTLSNNEQCKMFFHSKEWADLDQRDRDGHAYWKNMEILKKREEKTYYLCSFEYNSLESGIVTFTIIQDYNDKSDGVLFPLLFVQERNGWRMALSDVGYGRDIEMFYGDWDFWKNISKINEQVITDELRKIREILNNPSS